MRPTFVFFNNIHRVEVDLLEDDLKEIIIRYFLPRRHCVVMSLDYDTYYIGLKSLLKLQKLYQNESIPCLVIDKLVVKINRYYKSVQGVSDFIKGIDDCIENLEYIGEFEDYSFKKILKAFINQYHYIIPYEDKYHVKYHVFMIL